MVDTLITEGMEQWRYLLLLHQFAIEELRVKLSNLDEEFQLIQDYNPIEHIRYRVKKPSSIIEKLERSGLEPTIENARNHVFDIAGIRIICAFTADIYSIVEILSKHPELEVVQVKDYIKNPKPNGYRSLHVHILYPVYMSKGVERVRVEIQLRTIAMDFWASIEHKIYYKFREKAPTMIQAELRGCADVISTLDDRMYSLRRIISSLDADDANAKRWRYDTK